MKTFISFKFTLSEIAAIIFLLVFGFLAGRYYSQPKEVLRKVVSKDDNSTSFVRISSQVNQQLSKGEKVWLTYDSGTFFILSDSVTPTNDLNSDLSLWYIAEWLTTYNTNRYNEKDNY